MIVKYYATLRDAVGSRQAEFDLPPGSTLRQLVAEMAARYPALKAEILDPDGNLYSHIHIFVDGRDSTFLGGSLDAVLDPDATIAVFPPVGGG
ncbi:MAG TPA: ubiquitin-like small modifier protein 1 [Anaerolineales bacterium]